MRFQIGGMSVGDILDRGLKLLLSRLPIFYLINLIVLAPAIVLQVLIPIAQGETVGPEAAAVAAGGGLLVLVLTLILWPIGQAATLYIIAQEFVDVHAGLGEAFRFAFHRFGRLLGASIVVGLIVGIGMLLCLVPGVIFYLWYCFVPQVIVVEGERRGDALARSKELGEGYRGRIFGLVALVFTISLIAGMTVAALEHFVLPAQEFVATDIGPRLVVNVRNQVVHTLVAALVNILVQTFGAICLTLLYFDLRIRREGFDLELAAREQAAVVS
jgi:hypothetical protein